MKNAEEKEQEESPDSDDSLCAEDVDAIETNSSL